MVRAGCGGIATAASSFVLIERKTPRPHLRAGSEKKEDAMSLLFSIVTVTPRQGAAVTIQESGHPDEYDLRELLRGEARYASIRKAEYHGAAVRVCHYRFRVKGRDWLAERDSFALMDAYDGLALRCGEAPFMQREDVELLAQYTISLDLCDLCTHRGLLTMDDVGCCNCCDAGEFFDPDPHAGGEAATA